MTELVLRNRQRARPIRLPLLRRLATVLLSDLLSLGRYELAVHLVAAPEMARVNQRFLDHAGSTDVITFDYTGELDSSAAEAKGAAAHPPQRLHGEIFICIDDAVKQARQFRTSWQYELIRYLIHGMLHSVGYDDLTPAGRSVMKREENRLLRLLSRQFSLSHLANPRSSPARKSRMATRAASVSLSKRPGATRVRS